MICPDCGRTLSNTDRTCSTCSAPVATGSPAVQVNQQIGAVESGGTVIGAQVDQRRGISGGTFYGLTIGYMEDGTVNCYAPPPAIDLHAANARLEALPLDRVPPVAPLPDPSRIIYPANKLFTGRDNELQRIAAALLRGATATPTVAICGIGGVGKTTLAAEFAHRYGAYFAGGVWWLNCAEPALIAQEIATCGARLVDWRPDYRDLTLDDQVQLTLAVWQQPVPRLLIFDNCEDEEIVRRFRPPTGGCRVIITTRRAGWSAALGVDAQRLDVLHPEDAHALLLRYRPDLARDAAMVATLDAIAAELGGLPLALHLAGSYLETYRDDSDLGDPAAFLDEVRAMDVLDHDAMRGIDTSATPTDHERHVANTFLVSYRRLTPDASPADAHAVALLARAARLAPGEAIPRDLLLATLRLPEDDRSARREAARGLNRLLDLGLLESE